MKKEKEAFDPMVIEDQAELEEKMDVWKEIFMRCPDFSDKIIELYRKYSEDVVHIKFDVTDIDKTTKSDNMGTCHD